jgi:hypothetical protein
MYWLDDNFEAATTRKAQPQHIFNSDSIPDFFGLRPGKLALENTFPQTVFNTASGERAAIQAVFVACEQ